MMRSALLLFAVTLPLAGCGGAASSQPPPFEGHWRKYDDDRGHFVEFKEGRITLGDQTGSRAGLFTFKTASEEEPLYRVQADLDAGNIEFLLYYEGDTIDLIADGREMEGMYEIIFGLTPIER